MRAVGRTRSEDLRVPVRSWVRLRGAADRSLDHGEDLNSGPMRD